jgi:hypothetical protein
MRGIEMRAVSAPPGARLEGEDTAAAVAVFIKWLRLAATPAFAIMALLTGLMPDQMYDLCSAGTAAPLTGMAAMYLLMSVFHLPPWPKLIAHRRGTSAWLQLAP